MLTRFRESPLFITLADRRLKKVARQDAKPPRKRVTPTGAVGEAPKTLDLFVIADPFRRPEGRWLRRLRGYPKSK
jgi:hypothetical protein